MNDGTPSEKAYLAAMEAFCRFVGSTTVMEWADHPGRTTADACQALRGAADVMTIKMRYTARARDLLRTHDQRFDIDLSLASVIADEMMKVREEVVDEITKTLEPIHFCDDPKIALCGKSLVGPNWDFKLFHDNCTNSFADITCKECQTKVRESRTPTAGGSWPYETTPSGRAVLLGTPPAILRDMFGLVVEAPPTVESLTALTRDQREVLCAWVGREHCAAGDNKVRRRVRPSFLDALPVDRQ